jgi:hypothetical protein
MKQKPKQHHLMYGARRLLKIAPCILQSFLSINQIVGAEKWMARWQEQEDGSMRNSSIVELAKDW